MTDAQHTALPAPPRASTETALQPQVLAGPSFGRDLVRTLHQATTVVGGLAFTDGGDGSSDVEVSAFGAIVCTGDSPADALQAAAAVARQAPSLEIHALAWARTDGPREGTFEYKVTMTVTAPDPATGEHGGTTHHAARSHP
ncbi:hypothetical protein DEJ50_33625 [Streptomyces venezuelae]|uniref:Uncharacterized protein n=1 Tax=Streptomyces venezuelae TaxID=54571 RepID=A0A5P2DBC4_STRVZ|nr:hypothetical protein [Streptomyces venezuelae]QES52023.1 hypothetical protein DEJ50_33625 [Streptomyces venezuelae]